MFLITVTGNVKISKKNGKPNYYKQLSDKAVTEEGISKRGEVCRKLIWSVFCNKMKVHNLRENSLEDYQTSSPQTGGVKPKNMGGRK